MKKITQEELNKVIENHQHWLKEDCDGWENMRADLSYDDLSHAKNIPFIPMVCQDTGSFIGWKKASGKIVKLQIPEDARRSSSTGRKCRCDKAFVVGIE